MPMPDDDLLYDRAVAWARGRGHISVSGLQRELRIGYSAACRLFERMARERPWPIMDWGGAMPQPDPPGLILPL